MKNLLAKFYKSLACRVVLAIFATATVAHAHDHPRHFPLAPTDWGMIQQDCIGYHSSSKVSMDLEADPNRQLAEITVAQPDVGNPPEPLVTCDQLASHELIGPALYDGVDCAKLESYYRKAQSDQQADQLIAYNQAETNAIVATQPAKVDAGFEFHKSFFAACSCDFENRQANQSITPPKFSLKRTFVEDHFANEFNKLKPLVLRDLIRREFGRSQITGSQNEQLAIAIPTARVKNKHILADALSQFASYDCIVRSEIYSGHRAFQLGEFTGFLAKTWFSDTLPSASHFVGEYAQNLKPAEKLTAPIPMFVIFQTAAGNEVAIPIAQAKEWQLTTDDARGVQKTAVSQEFRNLVESADARLQWAGGRLSAAVSYMNDWFSDRIARAKSNDLR